MIIMIMIMIMIMIIIIIVITIIGPQALLKISFKLIHKRCSMSIKIQTD